MASKPIPSPEVLRQLLRYEPETGKLFWLTRGPEWFEGGRWTAADQAARFNTRYAGREAFTAIDGKGYLCGSVLNRLYRAHQVAVAIASGEWPSEEVDHINGDRTDNRQCNLRAVSRGENMKNICLRSDNTSGCVGVSWHKDRKRWRAYIATPAGVVHIGYFDSLAEAASARAHMQARVGYHRNHGRPSAGDGA